MASNTVVQVAMPMGFNDPEAFAFSVYGRAFAPLIQPGDFIIGSPATPPEDGGLVIIKVGEKFWLRRIRFDFTRNVIELTTDHQSDEGEPPVDGRTCTAAVWRWTPTGTGDPLHSALTHCEGRQ